MKDTKPRYVSWACVILLPFVAQGQAGPQDPQPRGGQEESLKALSLEALGNIEVTSVSKEPVKVTRTPAAIYVITQDDIRRSGVTNIPDALRLAPGVEVSRIDSNKWSVGMRGFASRLARSVLVLIDGRSVYNPLFAGVYWEVQDTVLADIDRIEIIRGPGGTIWGPNAVNGVINIITKSSKDTHGAFVSAGGGNVDQGLLSFRYGGGDGKGFNFRVYGKGSTRGPEFHPNGQNFDDWRMGQTGFRTDWDLNPRDTLTVQGDIYTAVNGYNTAIAQYSPPGAVPVEENGSFSGGNLLARWRRVLGEESDLQLTVSYDRTNRLEPTFRDVRDTVDIDFVHRLSLPGRQEFLWGLGARISPDAVTQVIPSLWLTPGKFTDQLYSAFIQDEIQLVNNQLWLTIGSKFLYNNYSGFEIQPTARILWTPDRKQSVWAAVTRAVRTPSRVEAALRADTFVPYTLPAFARLTGDGDFESETLVGYEFGYRNQIRPGIYLDLAAFRNNYDHLESFQQGTPFVETSPSPTHIVVPYLLRNGTLGSTSGFELAPSWKATRQWRLSGSYSYLHMDLHAAPGSSDTITPQATMGETPHHQVVVQSSLDLPEKLEFSQTYRYVSDLPAYVIAGYGTADARLAWRQGAHLEWSVTGQNLLQPHHAESQGSLGPPSEVRRGFYAAITWRSEK